MGRGTVARLMRRAGLRGVARGKTVRTTVRQSSASSGRIGRTSWVSDFTYVTTYQGFAYVAFAVDIDARRIVGWRWSTSARTDFVLDALEQTLYARKPFGGDRLIHHSDRGRNMSGFGTPSGSQRPAWSSPPEPSATHMSRRMPSTHWPSRSSTFA